MNRSFVSSVLGTLAAIALIVLVTKILGPIPLSITQTTTNKQNTFDVTGEGEVTAVPDRAKVNVGIQTSEGTVQAAQDKGNQIINSITRDVQGLGIDKADIKTVNYSLYPNYDFRTGDQKITGYALNVSLQVTVKDFTKINQVVDTATKNGANQVGGVTFTLSDEKQKELETQTREIAITRAKEKAGDLSRLAGVRLGKIINVTENNNSNFPGPLMYAKQDAAMGGAENRVAAPTNVEPGSNTYTMTVTLSYETL